MLNQNIAINLKIVTIVNIVMAAQTVINLVACLIVICVEIVVCALNAMYAKI